MKVEHAIVIDLLKQLIATASTSREEDQTAAIILQFLKKSGVGAERLKNNVWASNKYFDSQKPTLLAEFTSRHCKTKPGLHARSVFAGGERW